jgi:hypothetical protein
MPHTLIRRLAGCLAILLFVAGTALAGENDSSNKSHGFDDWPGRDSELRDGFDPTAVELGGGLEWGKTYHRQPAGGTRCKITRDKKTAASVTVRVADSALAAQEALLTFLMSCTRTIPRGENASLAYGDVTFASWEGNGSDIKNVHLVVFTRGNVLVIVNNFNGNLSADEMKKLADKLDKAISERPVIDDAADFQKPVITKKDPPPPEGEVAPAAGLVVEASDPRGLELIVTYDSKHADCTRAGNTLTFTAKKPGTYTVTVTATNKLNLSTTETFTFTVE